LCLTSESRTSKVNVLKNDTDLENNVIYLTSAEFVDIADTTLAYITVNAADSTVSLTVKDGANIGSGYIFDIIYNVKDDGTPASQCATGTLTVKVYPMPSYPDIRLSVCRDAGTSVNLSKYIDSLGVTGIQWTSLSGIPITPYEGVISMDNLPIAGVYSFTYTVSSICKSAVKRKVYLEVLNNRIVRQLKDTVVICYLYADAVNINRLFGVEAGGAWTYSSDSNDVGNYVKQSTSSVYGGAVVMDGKSFYEAGSLSSYHGVAAKIVKFTYAPKAGSCLHDKQYDMVIVFTDNILN
jgi:hypothetical protein